MRTLRRLNGLDGPRTTVFALVKQRHSKYLGYVHKQDNYKQFLIGKYRERTGLRGKAINKAILNGKIQVTHWIGRQSFSYIRNLWHWTRLYAEQLIHTSRPQHNSINCRHCSSNQRFDFKQDTRRRRRLEFPVLWNANPLLRQKVDPIFCSSCSIMFKGSRSGDSAGLEWTVTWESRIYLVVFSSCWRYCISIHVSFKNTMETSFHLKLQLIHSVCTCT